MGVFLSAMGSVGARIHGYFVNIARHRVLKELEVCDFDKTWSACQRDDGSCCDKIYEFLIW